MYQNSEEFSQYREYSSRSNEADYSNPEYYQQTPAPPRSAQPAQAYDPYAEQVQYESPVASPYNEGQMQVYRGPAALDGYTVDAGAEQRDAAQRGSAEGGKVRKGGLAGIGSALVALGAWLIKLKALAFLWTGLTAVVSIGIYALAFGWFFAIGLVVQLFIHEMGHLIVIKLKGIPVGGMTFIPLLGAAVTMGRMPQNARDEAEIGIAGPIAGAIAACVCLVIAMQPGALPLWAALAYFGFFINLFNLVPIVPFDGGRVVAAIDKRVWIVGFVGLLAYFIWTVINGRPSVWLIFFLIMGATQLWSRGFSSQAAEGESYYRVPLVTRLVIGLLYFGLAAVLVLGMSMAHSLLPIAQ